MASTKKKDLVATVKRYLDARGYNEYRLREHKKNGALYVLTVDKRFFNIKKKTVDTLLDTTNLNPVIGWMDILKVSSKYEHRKGPYISKVVKRKWYILTRTSPLSSVNILNSSKEQLKQLIEYLELIDDWTLDPA